MSGAPILLFPPNPDDDPPKDKWWELPAVALFVVVVIALGLGVVYALTWAVGYVAS